MRLVSRAFIGICGIVLAHGQTPPPNSGLLPDWDIRAVLEEMSAHAARLLPVLAQVDAQSWVAKGASETYVAQLKSSREQAQALSDGAKALARNPEKLSACLELYFRLAGLEDMLNSLGDGIRRYQEPALAQTLAGLSAENGANRNRFQVYIVNLADQREQECAIMDREAQRCRASIATQPTGASKSPAGGAGGRK
jgi:hypothetical protein